MDQVKQMQNNDYPFLKSGGEMGQLIRLFDWNKTTLGAPAHWPQSLKTTLSIVLNSKFPMLLYWGPQLICFYNDAFRTSLGQNGKHPSILGSPAADAWQDIWGFMHPLIDRVLAGGEATWYEDQLLPIYRNGRLEDAYWTVSYSPVDDGSAKLAGVFVTCIETTEKVIERQQTEENNTQLRLAIEAEIRAQRRVRDNESKLRQIILQAPVAIAIFRGPDYIVEISNARALELWGRTWAQVSNKPILDCMPELISQGIKELLDHVYQTGKSYSGTELPVDLHREGRLETAYINFSYEPLYDSERVINGIITIGFEVTEQVHIRKEIEQSEAEQYAMNEELSASNEALTAINEELADTQRNLQLLINELAISEARFRFLVRGAPVAIGVLNGPDLVIESANDMILKIWGKSNSILGKPLGVAVPELKGQHHFELLKHVYTSGKPCYGNKSVVLLKQEGEWRELYFDFIFQPLNDGGNNGHTIMIVAVDVTEQVNSRLEQQRTEEMLRFSVEAANAATWYMDAETREFTPSPRLRDLFGFQPDVTVSYDDVVNQIPEAYRDKVHTAIEKSVEGGEGYSMEHPVTGSDGKKRWVRALGKLYPEGGNRKAHFSGLILDITEQKEDELRKNDFIGMVSHELKTPLTSLTAYVQMLLNKAKTNGDTFTAGALNKANTQVKKMSTLINGFLNISRLESGKILITKQTFELGELINEMIDETQIIASAHLITLSACDSLKVFADRDKIGSVISNLLSNAVKYSPKGKHIDVQCKKIDGDVQLSVRDEGMGIKPHDLDKLFDRYYRVETKHTAHISGFGIGLYLSAEIIKRHNGKIGVESESGKGSTFWFTLPLDNS